MYIKITCVDMYTHMYVNISFFCLNRTTHMYIQYSIGALLHVGSVGWSISALWMGHHIGTMAIVAKTVEANPNRDPFTLVDKAPFSEASQLGWLGWLVNFVARTPTVPYQRQPYFNIFHTKPGYVIMGYHIVYWYVNISYWCIHFIIALLSIKESYHNHINNQLE
jgi:hypothetical protein